MLPSDDRLNDREECPACGHRDLLEMFLHSLAGECWCPACGTLFTAPEGAVFSGDCPEVKGDGLGKQVEN